ncbi:MAG: IMP dehydrogenase, partial [Sphingobacteriales bacterium]
MSLVNDKFLGEGLTYDDVLIVPAYSEVLPREVTTKTNLTRNITINMPLVSAAMDTVTEHKLAIAMAQEGGLGFLHKNMSIAAQAEQVRKVKRSESGLIQDPITLRETALLSEALQLMREHKIGGIPVVDSNNLLTGIITNRDLRFEHNTNRPVKEVMTKMPLVTAPEGTTLETAEEILQNHKIEKLPVVDKNNHLMGLITFRDLEKIKNYPNACKDGFGRLRVGAAVGVTHDTIERVEALVAVGVDVITIDTAHGHSKGVIETLKKVKATFPKLDVIVGNVATGAATKALIEAGADGVKVGIGPGSICTTRIIAGV